MYFSAMLNGEPAPGYSTGDAIKAIKEVAKLNFLVVIPTNGRA
jgi:hypothetical protein